LTATAPTVGQRNSVSPEKGTILKTWDHRAIYRLARAEMQDAFYPGPAQCEMQTLRRDVCSACQLRREMRDHGIAINHALLPSKGRVMAVPSAYHRPAF
jgi:hypothetical protein